MNKIPDIIYLTEYLTDDDILTLWSKDRVTDEDIKYINADKCHQKAREAILSLPASGDFRRMALQVLDKAFVNDKEV
jgi:hypothetical protein